VERNLLFPAGKEDGKEGKVKGRADELNCKEKSATVICCVQTIMKCLNTFI
jgi:hypothetical protein